MQPILRVTSAASSSDLTTTAAVKSALGITTADHDTRIATWIGEASSLVHSYCGRYFPRETVEETYFLGTYSDSSIESIPLKRFPTSSVTSVSVDDATIDHSDYLLEPLTGMLLCLDGGLPSAWVGNKLVVTYVGGYDLADVPKEIAAACAAYCKGKYYSFGRDPMAKRVEIPDVRTVDYWVGAAGGNASESPFTPDVTAALEPYREARFILV
jgi:hypothetical protein